VPYPFKIFIESTRIIKCVNSCIEIHIINGWIAVANDLILWLFRFVGIGQSALKDLLILTKSQHKPNKSRSENMPLSLGGQI
jgi:hypothetical protein